MNHPAWAEARAWTVSAAAAGCALWVGLYLNLFLLLFGPFPKDLAPATGSFATIALVVVAGSAWAPRRRTAVAAALAMLAVTTLMAGATVVTHAGGALAGAVAGTAWRWWRGRPTPSRMERSLGHAAVVVLAIGFGGVVYARYVDRPARPDPLPAELSAALGPDAAGVGAFFAYDLGGFIDRQWLWRLDATPATIDRLVSAFTLAPTTPVPDRFWRMPPHYWPRGATPSQRAYRSPRFSGEDRGPDGDHYFLLHDLAEGRAFLWVKNNF